MRVFVFQDFKCEPICEPKYLFLKEVEQKILVLHSLIQLRFLYSLGLNPTCFLNNLFNPCGFSYPKL
jgi:hypothetical protein